MPLRILYTLYCILYIVSWLEHDFIIGLNRNFATLPYIRNNVKFYWKEDAFYKI